MPEKFLIHNASQLQVFLNLYGAALVGCTSQMQGTGMNPDDIAARAQKIAVAATIRFEDHIPDPEDRVDAGEGKIVVPIKPEGEKSEQ